MINLMLIFIIFLLVLITNALPIFYTSGGILISGDNNDSIYFHVFLYIISFIMTVSVMILIIILMTLYYIKFIKNK
jgi:hypothetical protein